MPSTDDTWAVIMAGGIGSRFWPMSTAARPKQMLDLFGDGPMLKVTSERVAPLTPPERQIVVTGTILGDAVRAALPELPAGNVLEEPVGRNTAPAIGWAALWARRRDPDAVLMVLPADQYIANVPKYREICAQAIALARTGRIVTLGIPPTRPETGYGYIQRGAPLESGGFEVAAFKEKPDRETAHRYIQDGSFDWNAGMFFAPAQLMLDELERWEPDLYTTLLGLDQAEPPPALVAELYPMLTKISIDYAVMERSDKVAVIPGDFGWSDVGSWQSLYDFRGAAPSFARGDVIELDGGGNVLFADDGTVATVGVQDLVVVRTGGATLVCKRTEAQRVREIVAALEARGEEELL